MLGLFKYVYLACPIKGQIRKQCASHPLCHRTCNDDGSRPCPAICIDNGCECPAGTVIDVDKRECVDPSDCKGTHKVIAIVKVVKSNLL